MLKSMTPSEYADFQLSCGAKLMLVGDTWWREIRPRFYRPLFLFSNSESYAQDVPDKFSLGYQYPSGKDETGNSFINMLMIENPWEYSLDTLKSKRRKNIFRAQRRLTISIIDSPNQISDSLHEAYVSFYGRTKYGYRKDRLNKDNFYNWIKTVLNYEKIHVAGVYDNEKLVGMTHFCLINDVFNCLNAFYSQRAMELGAPELIFHYEKETASQCEAVKKMAIGTINDNSSIDYYYLSRGASLVPVPCHLRINPLISVTMKMFFKQRYKMLLGT